ncbi:hypothetical protein ACWCOW_34540 [Streptomyces sp. NPDC001939]
MSTTRGVARTPRCSTRLTRSEVRALSALAGGLTTDEARKELDGISLDTFHSHLRNVGLKQLKPPRASQASKVNTAYETRELPLPEAAKPPQAIEDEDRRLWVAVATHPDLQGIAKDFAVSTRTASRCVKDLMDRFGAKSAPHLVTLGYAYGVLPGPAATALTAG